MNQTTLLKWCLIATIAMLAYSQCDKCPFFQSQADCLSGVRNTKCRWDVEEGCIQKSCKDFVIQDDCYQETDTGQKCYLDPKRGCSPIIGGCTNVQYCNRTTWCKDSYNKAWCVDELEYTDKYCFDKLNENSCMGINNVDETSACYWESNTTGCLAYSRASSCATFNEIYHCNMMWGCMYINNTCVSSDCSYLSENECVNVRNSQFQYTTCAWNTNVSECQKIPKSTLNATQCLDFSGATYTFSTATNSCVPCQGSGSKTLLIGMAMAVIFMLQ